MVGAVAGTPGTPPTGWIYATTSSNGLAISVVGTGVENGINYIDYRFNGTTVASPSACAIGLVNATAATGQTWTASTYWKLVGGTATGVTGWNIGIIENTSGGVFVTGAFYSQTAPTSAALITQRPAATRTLSGGATVGLVTYPFNFAVAGNTAIDFTIRIGLPQLEQGAFATSVIPTTSATVTRAADVASITGANFGTTRTNLLLRSEDFSTTWTVFGGTVATNTTTAPNGTITADSFIANNGVGTSAPRQDFLLPDSTTYTASVFLKSAGLNSVNLQFYNKANTFHGSKNVDLSTGVLSGTETIGVTSVIAYGDGWYRLILSNVGSGTGATTPNFRIVCVSTGNGTSGIYVWGAQLETGSAATPYIPTTTATVSVFESSWYNQTAGSVYAEVVPAFQGSASAPINNPGVWGVTQNSLGSFNGYGVRLVPNSPFGDSINGISRYAPSAFNNQVSIGLTAYLNTGQNYKTMFAWEPSGIAGSSQGQTATTNTNPAAAAMGTHDQFYLGRQNVGGIPTQLNGTIKRLAFWPTRLSNTTLQQITQ
jgi:hypothetical protein